MRHKDKTQNKHNNNKCEPNQYEHIILRKEEEVIQSMYDGRGDDTENNITRTALSSSLTETSFAEEVAHNHAET